MNFGFFGECYNGLHTCSYLNAMTRERKTFLNGYPLGGMSEFCIKMKKQGKLTWLKRNNKRRNY